MSKYTLVLNTMLASNIENIATMPTAPISTNRQEVVDWYKSQLADEPWRDGQWHKVFKKGSDLEWFNPIHNLEIDNDYWGGIYAFKKEVPDEVIKNFRLYK